MAGVSRQPMQPVYIDEAMKHQPIYVCTVVRPNLMALPVPSVPVEPIARARMRQSTHDGGATHDGGCARHGYQLPCVRCEGLKGALAKAETDLEKRLGKPLWRYSVFSEAELQLIQQLAREAGGGGGIGSADAVVIRTVGGAPPPLPTSPFIFGKR